MVDKNDSNNKKKDKKSHRRQSSSNSNASDIEVSDASDNEKVHKKFKLDPADHSLVTMKCHYKSRHGKLRLTVLHLCFLARIQLGGSKKKLIPLNSILDIECDEKSGVTLTTRQGKTMVFQFKDNREAFKCIENQWINTGNGRGILEKSTTNSIEGIVSDQSSTLSPTSAGSGNRSRSGSINSTSSGVGNYRYSGNFDNQLNQSLTLGEKISDSYGNDLEKATHSMKKHFVVPHSESLVREYQCALKGELMQNHGKLYITQRFMFFYSGLASLHKKITIKLLDVVDICLPDESKKSILISTKEQAYLFTGFKDKRSNVFKKLNEFLYDAKEHGEVPEIKVSVGGFTNTPIQMLIGETESSLATQSPSSKRRGSISERLDKIEQLNAPIVLPEEVKSNEQDENKQETSTTTTNNTQPQQLNSSQSSITNSTTKDSNQQQSLSNSTNSTKDSSKLDKSSEKLEKSKDKSTKSSSSIWKPSKSKFQMRSSRDSNIDDKKDTTTTTTTTTYQTKSNTTPLPKSNTVSSYSSVSSIIASQPNTKVDSMDVTSPPTAATPLFDQRLKAKVKKRCCCF